MRSGPRLHVVLAAVLSTGLLFGGVGVPKVSAGSVDQQQQRVNALTDQLEALENRIGELEEEHAAALDRLDVLAGEIAVSQAKVDSQSAALGVLQGQLSNIAIDRYMSGGALGATPLLGSATSVTDDLQREQLSRVAFNQGAGSSDEMQALIDDLTAETHTLEARKAEQAQLIESLETRQTEGEALTAQYQQDLAAAKAELGNLIVEEQERRAAAAVAQAQARQAQTTAPPATPSRGGGVATGGTGTATTSDSGSGGNAPDAPSTPAADPAPAPSVPAPSSVSGIAVNAASGQLGVPYKFAAESPGVAFDCSGLTKYAWGKAGVYLPHQSAAQYGSTPHVPKDQAQPGDLIFYYSPIGHVGIYIGGGMMIHAPASGDVVKVAPVHWNKVVGVSRPGCPRLR
jgi:cell wall-associated NlpC family hydrolase